MNNPRKLRHLVTLSDPVPDGSPVTFTPSTVWAAIEPTPPGSFDEQRTTHIVTMRYHAQVTFNTQITHESRALMVKGIQRVEEKKDELVLLCEEVKTP